MSKPRCSQQLSVKGHALCSGAVAGTQSGINFLTGRTYRQPGHCPPGDYKSELFSPEKAAMASISSVSTQAGEVGVMSARGLVIMA